MNQYYKNYRSSNSLKKNKLRNKHIKALFEQFSLNFGNHLPVSKSSTIVDIGCGAGELIGWLQTKGYTNVSGYDLSEEQVQEAKVSFKGNFFAANVLDPNFDFPAADVYFLRDVLEHFDNSEIELLMSCLHQNTNPGGVIIIQTVNAATHSGLVTFYSDYTHKTCFTERSLSQLIRINLGAEPEFFPWYRLGYSLYSLKPIIILFYARLLAFTRRIVSVLDLGVGNKIFTSNIIAVINLQGEESA